MDRTRWVHIARASARAGVAGLLGLAVALGGAVGAQASGRSGAPNPLTARQHPAPGAVAGLQRLVADAPDVRGLSLADAISLLRQWNKGVLISTDPPAEKLPAGLDQALLIVLDQAAPPPNQAEASRPQVLLTLGSLVPDLTGLTLDQAEAAAVPSGLSVNPLVVDGQPVPVGSVVRAQRPGPGAPSRLDTPVTLIFGPPPTPPATAGPVTGGGAGRTLFGRPWWQPALGALVVLLIVAAIAAQTARRARRRRRARTGEQVSVRVNPGPPMLVRINAPGPDFGIRVVPRTDPGRVTVQEGTP